MILFSHIINDVNLELSDSEENISRIKFKNIIISTPETKYHQGIKGSGIKIYVLSPI